ncbi:hypothetical protein [Armatimonas rosea]|uniref:Y-family DNA polymerase n=1 Tax=Armatimonas rosea TaxID=685828 RepID=UPI00160CEFA5|nr:hypothetical protein [Armatimonas rosea]
MFVFTVSRPRPTLFCQVPGLLARAALEARGLDESRVSLTVIEGKLVRDASPLAVRRGVTLGESLLRARRLCPELLAVPLVEVDARSHSQRLWDALAELTDLVEPAGPDAAYALLWGNESLEKLDCLFPALTPFCSMGRSKLEARVLALSGVEGLADAPVTFLSGDPAITGKLLRLGLTTFGAVAEVGEAALIYQFGRKVGPLLYQRALGEDSDPVQALWPLPVVEASYRFDLEPIEDAACVDRYLVELAKRSAGELCTLRRFGRVVTLEITCERGSPLLGTWRPPWPVQSPGELLSSLRRLAALQPLRSGVIGLRLVVSELDLPTATTLSLFETVPASCLGRLESTKRWIRARYGSEALTTLSKVPVSLRDRRRELVREVIKR